MFSIVLDSPLYGACRAVDTADLREKAQRRVLLMTALVVAHDLVGFVPARLDSHAESMVLGDIVLVVADVITEQDFTIGIHHLVHACSALVSVLVTIVEVQASCRRHTKGCHDGPEGWSGACGHNAGVPSFPHKRHRTTEVRHAGC